MPPSLTDIIGSAHDLSLSGFSKPESKGDRQWVWCIGEKSIVRGENSTPRTFLRYRASLPQPETKIEIRSGERIVREFYSKKNWHELSGQISLPANGPWEISFSVDKWNGNGLTFSEGAREPFSFSFYQLELVTPEEVEILPAPGHLCVYPFARMETDFTSFSPCCRFWITEDLSMEDGSADPWNSKAAQELRKSILNGSYKYCRREVCKTALQTLDELRENPYGLAITPANFAAISAGSTLMPDGPTAITVTADPRCNLACPSCRSHHIQKLTSAEEEEILATDVIFKEYASTIEQITFATNGEVFFSPYLRSRLQSVSRERFPALKFVTILSNGVLFDQTALQQLSPGTDFIRRVEISVDAGDAGTYEKVRGGDWNRLQKNLRWLSSLRHMGRLDYFSLNFVLQQENFRSLPAFFTLARDLGIDEISLTKIVQWNNSKIDAKVENIDAYDHPLHSQLVSMWSSLTAQTWPFRLRNLTGLPANAAFISSPAHLDRSF